MTVSAGLVVREYRNVVARLAERTGLAERIPSVRAICE